MQQCPQKEKERERTRKAKGKETMMQMATPRQPKAKAKARANPEAEAVLKAKARERTAANLPKEKEKVKVAEGPTVPVARPQVFVTRVRRATAKRERIANILMKSQLQHRQPRTKLSQKLSLRPRRPLLSQCQLYCEPFLLQLR